MPQIKLLFIIAILFRLASVAISIVNERKLKNNDAVEYGTGNSRLLILMHVIFYISCGIELIINKDDSLVTTSVYGFCLYTFSILILYYVIYSLKPIWTLKLIIAPKIHLLNKGFLFRYFKHPNYYLSVIPELLGLALYCRSWHSLIFLFPLYLIPLIKRIVFEEKVMRDNFPEY